MKIHRILVDFNESIEPDLVLLSKTDERIDSAGKKIPLSEGKFVEIYAEDKDVDGLPDNLIAEGIVEKNVSDLAWTKLAKWCCRISSSGIRWESDEK